MFTAAFDERLKVIVSSCGFCSFAKYYGGNLKGWTSDRYMPRIASEYDNDPKQMPFEFADVVTAFAPRAFLAVAPVRDDNFAVGGVKDVIAAAEPVYKALGQERQLKAIYPDAAHDFPEAARKTAYEFIESTFAHDVLDGSRWDDCREAISCLRPPTSILPAAALHPPLPGGFRAAVTAALRGWAMRLWAGSRME